MGALSRRAQRDARSTCSSKHRPHIPSASSTSSELERIDQRLRSQARGWARDAERQTQATEPHPVHDEELAGLALSNRPMQFRRRFSPLVHGVDVALLETNRWPTCLTRNNSPADEP